MKFLQKLGKALMLPVAVLPICGILMGIGYWLCPATMQGGEIQGVANLIGLFLVKAGGALIDNMAILFAIGVGVGMSEKNDGTGGIAALASWLMLTTLLSTGFVTTIMPSIAEDATKTLAFDKIANPFIGIIAGIIGSMCYNKFKDTKLPDWLSFFSGKRCVAIVAGVVSILASVVLLFVWPLLFGGLVALGEAIVSLDVVGAGIYAFLNRLLIPTGLHHALNNVFWFDTIGLGDLQHFWAGETSADVSWSLGMYMSGFFPCMMFGIPGAALAMIQSAKSNKKKSLTVKWRKVNGVKGYQLRYATNKKMKKAKIITITKNKLVIKKLAKKKYYIQVCAYKVNSNGKKVKGKWSAKKAIKVKK